MVTRVVTVGTVELLTAVPGALLAARGVTPVEWLWLRYLAILGTGVTYLIWTTALPYLPAGETAAFMFLVPIMAGTWSAIILGERPTATGITAGVIVLAGVALTQTDRTTIGGTRIGSRLSRSEPRGEGPLPTK